MNARRSRPAAANNGAGSGGVPVGIAVSMVLMQQRGAPPEASITLAAMLGLPRLTSSLLGHVAQALIGAFLFFILLFLLRLLVRREWIAGVIFAAGFALARGFASGFPAIMIPAFLLIYGLLVLLLLRFGLAAVVLCIFVADLMEKMVFTANFGAWFGTPSLVASLVVIGLAVWAFRTSLAGRTLLETALGD